MEIVRRWFRRQFSNPQLVVLLLILVACFATILFFGRMLLPLLISLVLAYLLDSVVMFLQRLRAPRLPAVIIVYSGFLAAFVVAVLIMVPLLTDQIRDLAKSVGKLDVEELVDRVPDEFWQFLGEPDPDDIQPDEAALETPGNGGEEPDAPPAGSEGTDANRPETADGGEPLKPDEMAAGSGTDAKTPVQSTDSETSPQSATEENPTVEDGADPNSTPAPSPRVLLKRKLKGIPNDIQNWMVSEYDKIATGLLDQIPLLIQLLVYAILIPTLVFFMLKDKRQIQLWFQRFLPPERDLATQVWQDLDRQIGNYIRGKFWEILIIGGASYITFAWFELNFALLLGISVGLSVVVPYIGATVITLPVAIVGYTQFGATSTFAWLMVAYFVIQILDGNVLVPLLFSEVVSLHPIAIIAAILLFGGFWGFLGVFFAIPLATLVQAIIKAWPRPSDEPAVESS